MTNDVNFGGDPSPEDPDNFASQDAAEEGTPEDNEVVLEIGGRKFTKSSLVKKLTSADQFIEQLKEERKKDREEMAKLAEVVTKAGKIDEVMEKLMQQQANQASNQANNEQPKSETTNLDAEALAKQVMDQFRQEQAAAESERSAKANFEMVQKALTNAYGSKTAVNTMVDKVASEVGMSREELATLAKTKPQVFLRMFPDVSAPKPSVGGITGNTVRVPVNQDAKQKAALDAANKAYANARTTKDRVNAFAEFKQTWLKQNLAN